MSDVHLCAGCARCSAPAASSAIPTACPAPSPTPPRRWRCVCRLAHEERWKIRIEGQGTWLAADAPADLARQHPRARPGRLREPRRSRRHGAGRRRRSTRCAAGSPTTACGSPSIRRAAPSAAIGSIVATATAGPLRLGFGPVRDHVLGLHRRDGRRAHGQRRRPGGEERRRLRSHQAAGRRVRRVRHHHRAAPPAPGAAPGRRHPASPAAPATR